MIVPILQMKKMRLQEGGHVVRSRREDCVALSAARGLPLAPRQSCQLSHEPETTKWVEYRLFYSTVLSPWTEK